MSLNFFFLNLSKLFVQLPIPFQGVSRLFFDSIDVEQFGISGREVRLGCSQTFELLGDVTPVIRLTGQEIVEIEIVFALEEEENEGEKERAKTDFNPIENGTEGQRTVTELRQCFAIGLQSIQTQCLSFVFTFDRL